MKFLRLTVMFTLACVPVLGASCMKCRHTAYRESLCLVEHVSVIAPARAKVQVFLMNGVDVFDLGGLSVLQTAIVDAGFSKVYYAQRFDVEWYYREIHRVHRDDPDNRFVLIGQGAAATQLQELACRLTNDGISLDAVIYLDPTGVNTERSGERGYPSYVMKSGERFVGPRIGLDGCSSFDRLGRKQCPEHPAASTIIAMLTVSAHKVPFENPALNCVPILDENKPIPKPGEPKQVPAIPPEWDFLCPKTGQG
jgi:hypothetical protein